MLYNKGSQEQRHMVSFLCESRFAGSDDGNDHNNDVNDNNNAGGRAVKTGKMKNLTFEVGLFKLSFLPSFFFFFLVLFSIGNNRESQIISNYIMFLDTGDHILKHQLSTKVS